MKEENVIKLFMLILAICVLAASAVFFYLEQQAGGVTFAALFIICLIFGFLARFKRFRGLGIEAELWEQAQIEAEELTERLRRLAVVVSKQTLDNAIRIGRWGTYYRWPDLVRIRQELLDTIDAAADRREATKQIDRIILRYLYFDYFQTSFESFKRAFDECHRAERVEIDREAGSPIADAVGYGKRIEDWQRKRESIDEIMDAASRMSERKLGLQWKKAFDESMRNYGPCLQSKLSNVSQIQDDISRLCDLEKMETFDVQQIQDIFEAIANRQGHKGR